MDLQEEILQEPVSPTGQYFNSSVLSVSILAVLESAIPIDDSSAMSLLRNLFIPINPRFSSIMIEGDEGTKQWKRVEVKLQDHINVPIFPENLSPESYDECLDDYLSRIVMEPLPQSRPLWNIHIIKYPTSNAAGTLVFKLHHALGDGYSLMGALLSCLQRADNPALPLTFPSIGNLNTIITKKEGILKNVPRVISSAFNTASDFAWSLLKSSVIEDDRTPIRSGVRGVEHLPISISTMTFSLDQIKEIKTKLCVTINDVITGIIFLGTRIYMEQMSHGSSSNANSTALVLLNTRNVAGYKSVQEMLKPNTDTHWGNNFGFLQVSIPNSAGDNNLKNNPLEFVFKAQEIIKKKRSSLAVHLTAWLLDAVRKYRGPLVTAKCIHTTLMNSSMTISNLVGPVEPMALANHPVKGIYFMVVNVPQSLTITLMSYMDKLRVSLGAEKGYIHSKKFKSCLRDAFEMVYRDALHR